jgi:thioredoxin-like negative regulator of GroEL
LIREIYPQEDFKKMGKYFVFVKINGDQQPSVFQQYGVSAMPTIIFMKPDGTAVHQFLGYRDLGTYLSEMNKARQAAGN